MRGIMIDLETLGTSSMAPVVQIGIVTFDYPTLLSQEFLCKRYCWNVIPWPCQMKHADWDTIRWWLEQSDEARKSITTGYDPQSLAKVLEEVCKLFASYDFADVWAHGTTFDIPIFSNLFKLVGYKLPFNYRNVRDTRTMAMMYPNVKRPEPSIRHDAGYDAEAQARWMFDMLRTHMER